MGDLSKQILAEKENVEKALSNLKEAIEREKKSVVELAAMGTISIRNRKAYGVYKY